MNVGKNIQTLRKKEGLTQDELALKCGISKNALWNYENNKRIPPISTIDKISKIFNINSSILISENPFEQTDSIYYKYKDLIDFINNNASHLNIDLDELTPNEINELCKFIMESTKLKYQSILFEKLEKKDTP